MGSNATNQLWNAARKYLLFNLLPAYPLDGGTIAEDLLGAQPLRNRLASR